jgi:hypothetical protein
VDNLEALVTGREGWSMEGEVAQYGPAANGWSARVRFTEELLRLTPRWQTSVCSPDGVARHTRMARTPLDAVTFAEGVITRQRSHRDADRQGRGSSPPRCTTRSPRPGSSSTSTE